MSSKNISKSVGVDRETVEFLEKKAIQENNSFSGVVGRILREYRERMGNKGDEQHAN